MIKKNITREIIGQWREQNKTSAIEVSGTSMMPLIKEGSVIKIDHKNSGKIKSGDIVLFKTKNDTLVVHRIIKRIVVDSKLFFIEKGDKSGRLSLISGEDILGKVVEIRRGNYSIKTENIFWEIANRAIGCYWFLILAVFAFLKDNGKKRLPFGELYSHYLVTSYSPITFFFSSILFVFLCIVSVHPLMSNFVKRQCKKNFKFF